MRKKSGRLFPPKHSSSQAFDKRPHHSHINQPRNQKYIRVLSARPATLPQNGLTPGVCSREILVKDYFSSVQRRPTNATKTKQPSHNLTEP